MTNSTYFLIAWALIFIGCIMYFKVMISLIINRTRTYHTIKPSTNKLGLNLGAMKCVVKNPYKQDKKMKEYVKKARIAIGVKIVSFVLLLILTS